MGNRQPPRGENGETKPEGNAKANPAGDEEFRFHLSPLPRVWARASGTPVSGSSGGNVPDTGRRKETGGDGSFQPVGHCAHPPKPPLDRIGNSWQYNRQNMGAKQWRDFKYLRESALKTARAWAIEKWAIGE